MSDTQCPDCDVELVVTDQFDQTTDDSPGPLQGSWLTCPEDGCSFETCVTIIQYPDERFVALAAARDETCSCGSEGRWIAESSGGKRTILCARCEPEMYQTSYRTAVKVFRDG